MTRLLYSAVAAGTLTVFAVPSDAEAYTGVYLAGGSVQVSPQPYYGGAVYGAAFGGYGSYAVLPPVYPVRTFYRGSYGHATPPRHARWHSTPHYDYHPAEVRRHGNHFHVTPGHYDLHEDGHWDVH